jgi:hypothetical protein
VTAPKTKAVPDRKELLALLGVQARKGNVPAMRLLLQYHDASTEEEANDFIDELASKRGNAGS